MSKMLISVLVGFGILVMGVFIIAGMFISTSNQEATLRVAIVAKQTDNTSEFDNMFKKISQVAQVTSKQMESLKEIFNGYAQARSSGGDNQIMTWVKEAIPNVDTTTFNNLQNIITSSRDSWTMRQKELIDLNREHQKLLSIFPSNVILSMLGRKSIEIKIVTSTRTDRAFETGKDDDTKVF